MRGFQTVDGDSVSAIVELDGVVLVRSFEDWIRTMVGGLQWFAYRVVANENMCGCRQVLRNV